MENRDEENVTGNISEENIAKEDVLNAENTENEIVSDAENAANEIVSDAENAANDTEKLSGTEGMTADNAGNTEKADTASTADSSTAEERKAYTGEYGNSVMPGEHDGTYSFSYKDNPDSATASGDFHKEDMNEPTGQTNNDKQSEMNNQDYYNYKGKSSSNTNFNTNDNQDVQNTASTADNSSAPEDAKDKTPFFSKDNLKKLGKCACYAVVFGVLAAICFKGVCYLSDKVLGTNKTGTNNIAYTTDGVNYSKTTSGNAIGQTNVTNIVENTMPSIVAITSTQKGQDYYSIFGQYYQGNDTTSAGSGFIVGENDTELLIATNNHVIEGAEKISVQFIDNKVCEGSVKGTDSSADLAVVAVKLSDVPSATMKKIKIAKLGDSSETKVGEMAVAIGNSLGYGQSVTVGYISAKDREITETDESTNAQNTIKVIQTDAAINPGNSGGPLLNTNGEVVGINSAKISDSSVEGVGYAIPISDATPIIDELMNKEVLTDSQKGYLGITGMSVTDSASAYNMPEGIYVKEVAKDGAADKGGVLKGDIITAINDIKVTTIESLKEKANSYKVGTTVTLTLERLDNGEYKKQTVKVKLQSEKSLESLPDNSSQPQATTTPDANSNGGSNGSDGENSFPFSFGN